MGTSLVVLRDFIAQLTAIDYKFKNYKNRFAKAGQERGQIIELANHIISGNSDFDLCAYGPDFPTGDCKVITINEYGKPAGDTKISIFDYKPYVTSNVIHKLQSYFVLVDPEELMVMDVRKFNFTKHQTVIEKEFAELTAHINNFNDVVREPSGLYLSKGIKYEKINYRGNILAAKILITKNTGKVNWSINIKSASMLKVSDSIAIYDDVVKDIKYFNSMCVKPIEEMNTIIKTRTRNALLRYTTIQLINEIQRRGQHKVVTNIPDVKQDSVPF